MSTSPSQRKLYLPLRSFYTDVICHVLFFLFFSFVPSLFSLLISYPFFNTSFFITLPLCVLCTSLFRFHNPVVTGKTSYTECVNRKAIINKTTERRNTEWPKKCIHSLLINIFGINLNEISISG